MSDQGGQVITFESITVDKGNLYGVFKTDHALQLYPLFVFHPLEEAYVYGEYINYAPYWPKFMQKILLTYVPVKYVDFPGQGYGRNERSADPLRPWPQLQYNGWPLYFIADGEILGVPAEYTTMFVPATEGIAPPVKKENTTGDDGGVGGPPGPSLGP